jgi:ABC-type Na+ efflux pump permease subunit
MRMRPRLISLLVRRELVDFRRQRRVWRRLFLQPILIASFVAIPALFVNQAQNREQASTFDVAVEGDVGAVPGLDEALSRRPLRWRASADPGRAVVERTAEVGLVIAAGPRLRVLELPTDDASRFATVALMARLEEVRRRVAVDAVTAAGAPADVLTPYRVTSRDLAVTSPGGTRFGLAQALPVLLVLQLFGLMTTAQDRLGGAKDQRVLESLLVLPLRRVEVLAGVGLAVVVLGLAVASLLLVPLTALLTLAVAALERTVAGPVEVAMSMVLGALLLAGFFASVGLYAGARAHSGGEGNAFVTVAQIGIFALVAIAPLLAEVPARGPLLAVPVVGPMTLVREGIASGLDLRSVLITLAGAAAVIRLLVGRARHHLESEASLLRATS